MRSPARLPLIVHATGWTILGCAFVLISIPHIWAAFRSYSVGPVQPNHTTDAYMASLAKVRQGSERLEQAFSALSAKQPVAVIVPEGSDEGIFLGYLVSYFAWPREVHSVTLTRANAAAELRAVDRASLSALFFCGMDPPAGMTPAFAIGSGLVMVPAVVEAEGSRP